MRLLVAGKIELACREVLTSRWSRAASIASSRGTFRPLRIHYNLLVGVGVAGAETPEPRFDLRITSGLSNNKHQSPTLLSPVKALVLIVTLRAAALHL